MLPDLRTPPPKPVTVMARVVTTTSEGSLREYRDPRTNVTVAMEVGAVRCASFSAVDMDSGKRMANLPGAGLDLIPGDRVRVTVEKM